MTKQKSNHKSFDPFHFLSNVTRMIDDVKKGATQARKKADHEIAKVIDQVSDSFHEMEHKVEKAQNEIKKKAQVHVMEWVKKVHDVKDNLPLQFQGEVDKLLDIVGLQRKKPSVKKAKTSVTKKAKSVKKAATSKIKAVKKGVKSAVKAVKKTVKSKMAQSPVVQAAVPKKEHTNRENIKVDAN